MNIKTNMFVYATDYRYHPPHQRTSKNQMLTFPDKQTALLSLKNRRCGKDYRVVVLKTVEIKKIIEE